MSLQSTRIAIESYFITTWADATPYGLSNQVFTPVTNSVRMTIRQGRVTQNSIGRVQNVFNNIGVLMFQIFTDGAIGEATALDYADTLKTMFHGKTLDASGLVVTSGAQTPLVRFSPPELGADSHPYSNGSEPVTPWLMTNVNCPFVSYELR